MGRRKSGEGESAAQLSRTRPFRNVKERLGVTEVRHTNPRKKKDPLLPRGRRELIKVVPVGPRKSVDFKSFESEA